MNRVLLGVSALVLLALGAGAGVWLAKSSMSRSPASAPAAAAPSVAAAKKPLYWHDPMYPQQKFDKPGKSPFMDMQLVPVYGDEPSPETGVKVEGRLAQNLGARTVVAESGRLEKRVEAVGTVAFDERSVAVVQVRTAGFIEKLHVRAALDPVRRGQPLAELFVPEWAGAQQEYLALKSSPAAGAAELAQAARNRLMLLGMSEEQLQAVDRGGKPVTRVTLHSPIDGVVGELGAREGMNVTPGTTLFRLNGLGTVWVNIDVAEAQAASIRPGAPIVATVPAYPGETFSGRVAAVLPEVAATTRTLRARVELANPGGRLKPGMYAKVSIDPHVAGRSSVRSVLIPSEAVIMTGERNVVIVDRGSGRFEPVEVKVGGEEGGRTEILSGIEPGTRVVASGQFLIDSEASLRGAERRMDTGPAMGAGAAQAHRAEGVVKQADAKSLLIAHGPVASAGMDAMTMEFAAPRSGLPPGLKAGDRIEFEFVINPGGGFEATRVTPKAGAKP